MQRVQTSLERSSHSFIPKLDSGPDYNNADRRQLSCRKYHAKKSPLQKQRAGNNK
jgi:hypothetical protein